jgi:hypothetical protein
MVDPAGPPPMTRTSHSWRSCISKFVTALARGVLASNAPPAHRSIAKRHPRQGLADSRSLHRTVLAGVWRVVAGSTGDRPVVGRFVVGEATFHGAGTSHGGTAFRGEAGFHGAPAGRCQITSWSGKGAGGSLSHDRYLLSRPSLSPDTHPTRRLAVPPVHLELPEMWRSFSDGAKERQETGSGPRHRYRRSGRTPRPDCAQSSAS